MDINGVGKDIKKSVITTVKESLFLYEKKEHNPKFDEECLKLLDQKKQTKMQWLKDPNQRNLGNLNSVSREVRKHFKKREGISDC